MPHIYSCMSLNERNPVVPFEKVNNGSISEQHEILQRFEQNLNKRSEIKQKLKENEKENNSPCDRFSDPLNCSQYRNG